MLSTSALVRSHPGVGAWRPRRVGLVALAILCVSACAGKHVAADPPPSPSSTSPTVAPSPSPADAEALLRVYTDFWPTLAFASSARGAAAKREILSSYAADPALSTIVNTFVKQNSRGEAYYGHDVTHPVIQSLVAARGIAVVRDCQESNHAGIQDARTGKPKTVGPPRNLVFTTMHRLNDGWRIVFIRHAGSKC